MYRVGPSDGLSEDDRLFVDEQIDALLEDLFEHAQGSEEKFGSLLAHFVAMTVAPSLAATNMVLQLPRISDRNRNDQVRCTISGDAHYVSELGDLESDLAEAVTTAVLQTLLGPSPRIPTMRVEETPEELFLN
jgi:hypothetical protein